MACGLAGSSHSVHEVRGFPGQMDSLRQMQSLHSPPAAQTFFEPRGDSSVVCRKPGERLPYLPRDSPTFRVFECERHALQSGPVNHLARRITLTSMDHYAEGLGKLRGERSCGCRRERLTTKQLSVVQPWHDSVWS